MNAREQLIVELWATTLKESVGAAELELVQRKLPHESPASIARTLADHGARLDHPEILEADVRWREREVFTLFSPEELNFASLAAATAWIEKVNALRETKPEMVEQLRQLVVEIKSELELVGSSPRVPPEERDVATEVAHWLAVWLQNPPIFADWLSLRLASPEFLEHFGPFRG